jgi:excisionase family DNA binding protein
MPSTSELLNTRAVLSVAECAEVMDIGTKTAYEAVKAGTLPSIRYGRRILIPVPLLLKHLSGEWRPESDDPTAA